MQRCAAGTDNSLSDLDPERRNAGVALALLSLIWGYNWVAMKAGLADAGPLQFAALRFTLAALCMIGVDALLLCAQAHAGGMNDPRLWRLTEWRLSAQRSPCWHGRRARTRQPRAGKPRQAPE